MAGLILEFPDGLNPRVDRAAMALGLGLSQIGAARFADVNPRTLRRWKSRPDFRELVDQYSQHTLYRVAARVESLQLRAVEKIAELMTSADNESVQLKAAALLTTDLGPRLREERALVRRLAALEHTAAADELTNGNANARNWETER
jgi:hypothetical protein